MFPETIPKAHMISKIINIVQSIFVFPLVVFCNNLLRRELCEFRAQKVKHCIQEIYRHLKGDYFIHKGNFIRNDTSNVKFYFNQPGQSVLICCKEFLAPKFTQQKPLFSSQRPLGTVFALMAWQVIFF
jgi:hypothetical protein